MEAKPKCLSPLLPPGVLVLLPAQGQHLPGPLPPPAPSSPEPAGAAPQDPAVIHPWLGWPSRAARVPGRRGNCWETGACSVLVFEHSPTCVLSAASRWRGPDPGACPCMVLSVSRWLSLFKTLRMLSCRARMVPSSCTSSSGQSPALAASPWSASGQPLAPGAACSSLSVPRGPGPSLLRPASPPPSPGSPSLQVSGNSRPTSACRLAA